MIKSDDIGSWVIDTENNGTPEHPIHFPFVSYSEVVSHFMSDVYAFVNEDEELTRYRDILKENNIEWDSDSMEEVDVSSLNGKCIIALIIGVLREDYFCEGALFEFFKNGSILKWLERLAEIDNY